MIYNHLFDEFIQIENMIASHDPKIDEKLLNLATYIKNNGEAIQNDLIKHEDHFLLLHKIQWNFLVLHKIQLIELNSSIVNEIHNTCDMLIRKALLNGDKPKNLAEWIIKKRGSDPSGSPKDLFYDLSKARTKLIEADLLAPKVGNALSDFITKELGLKGEKDAARAKAAILSSFKQNSLEGIAHWINTKVVSLRSDRLTALKRDTLEALAHWINSEKIPLKNVGLSENELEAIAPYLHYVNCEGLNLNNPEKFISLCSNAYSLQIHNKKIKKLEKLPPQLQELDCRFCDNLASVDLSNNPKLEKLNCSNCKVETLDVSNNPQLEILNCTSCLVKALNVTNNPKLKILVFSHCPVETLNLSNNPQLTILRCNNSKLLTLNFSHNPLLDEIDCSNTQISTLDFSDNPKVKTVNCSVCPNLTSLGEALPDTIKNLNCEECRNLRQLPQVPATATIYSNGSGCGNLKTFKIFPADLEKKPKQVLLELGKILLQNEPFPNIVYMDPKTNQPTEGRDAGGLRRQLITTLCDNLFKKGSEFPFLEEAGYKTPIFEGGNTDALRTFARLLGLAATSSLLTGTTLSPAFFHTLFTLSDQEIDSVSDDLPVNLKKKLYMARQGEPLEAYTENDDKGLEEENSILRATAIAAKELKATLGKQFRPQSIEEFIVDVQGIPITKEKFKENILCENNNYKLWMDNLIDELQPDELKNLLMLFTGYYSLGGGPIVLEVFPTRKYLESETVIHTCFQTMELPGDLTEELLHKELKDQLSLLITFNAN